MKQDKTRNRVRGSLLAMSLFVIGAGHATADEIGRSASTSKTISAERLVEGTNFLQYGTVPEGLPGGAPPGGFGTAGTVDHGDYATLVAFDTYGETYQSSGGAENAARVSGDVDVTISNAIVVKDGGAAADGDGSNFYGANAALLAMDGATFSIDESSVTTSTDGANGVFSYGDGTTVTVIDTTISTTGDSSGGIMVAGGGTMYVYDSEFETDGQSSAALRTDRGGGTLVVEGGEYTTHGSGSPVVYSTADVTIRDAVLTATGSEAIVVEGKNSVTLEECLLSGNMLSERSENMQNVMIYQSMSGDADVGTSTFAMMGGTLTSASGDMIYVTNTQCEIVLEEVDLSLSNDVLLRVVGNDARTGWGEVGSNGGICAFTAIDQELTGTIIVDEISSLTLDLIEGSTYHGAVDAQAGTVAVTLDESSSWTLTADSWVSSIAGSVCNVDTNGFTLYVAGEALE